MTEDPESVSLQTVLTTSPELAASFIKRSEIVAFPTETVYGLGANIFDEQAIRKIFRAKGRPADNPLIAHIADLNQLDALAANIPPSAGKMIEAFFPAPLTLILPKHPAVPALATAGLETIGVRMPRHEQARAFIRACGAPLVAPSANLSGSPSPTTWQAVLHDLAGRIACILQGEQTEVGLESTVVDCAGAAPLVLRAGAITLEELQAVIPQTSLAAAPDAAAPKSPGLKYRHYAPRARVVLVRDLAQTQAAANAAFIGLRAPANLAAFKRSRLCAQVEEYAHELFAFFRECDQAGVETIYCEAVAESGLGRALLDRIERAAHRG
jgi:L-threonylcarbamoyladenylate synthase